MKKMKAVTFRFGPFGMRNKKTSKSKKKKHFVSFIKNIAMLLLTDTLLYRMIKNILQTRFIQTMMALRFTVKIYLKL